MDDSTRWEIARDFAGEKYLAALDAALAEGGERIPAIRKYLTETCPECGENGVDANDRREHLGDHLHVMAPGPHPDDPYQVAGRWVAIGCEGYAVVNPNVLGLTDPGWDDWTTYPA